MKGRGGGCPGDRRPVSGYVHEQSSVAVLYLIVCLSHGGLFWTTSLQVHDCPRAV